MRSKSPSASERKVEWATNRGVLFVGLELGHRVSVLSACRYRSIVTPESASPCRSSSMWPHSQLQRGEAPGELLTTLPPDASTPSRALLGPAQQILRKNPIVFKENPHSSARQRQTVRKGGTQSNGPVVATTTMVAALPKAGEEHIAIPLLSRLGPTHIPPCP